MAIARHAWTVAKNLIATVVILAMFSRVSGSFETMVIAGLTMIYTVIVNGTALLAQGLHGFLRTSTMQFTRVAELLNAEEARNYEGLGKELEKQLKDANVDFAINTGFNLLFWAIALVNILRVL